MPPPAAARLQALRDLLDRAAPPRPAHAPARFPTGVPALDLAANGGLPAGAITEIRAPAAGSALLIHQILLATARRRLPVALIDGADTFDPASCHPDALRHMLWVRCQTAAQALQAADLLARDGSLPLLILDLRLNPAPELRALLATTWFRLQRVLEHQTPALLLFTRRPLAAACALRLHLNAAFGLQSLEIPPDTLATQLAIHPI